jgi:hypothetical protein
MWKEQLDASAFRVDQCGRERKVEEHIGTFRFAEHTLFQHRKRD